MSAGTVIVTIGLVVLIANGLRVIIGIPPVRYWFRSRTCPLCEGVGYLMAHTHTGEIMEIRAEDALAKLRESA